MRNSFFIRENGKYIKISFQEIVYFEGCRNYIKIITDVKVHLVLFTMKRMEKLLPAYLFKRIHKSYIVSLDKITGFDSEKVFLKDKELPVGQHYKSVLEQVVLIFSETTDEFNSLKNFNHSLLAINPNQKNKHFGA